MNMLRKLFSLRQPEQRSNKTSSESSCLKQTDDTAGNNPLSNDSDVQVDVTKEGNDLPSNGCIKANVAKESKAVFSNGDIEVQLTEERNVLSNDHNDVNTKEIDACKGVNIVGILNKVETNSCKNMNKVHKAKKAKNRKIDKTAQASVLKKLLNNMDLIVAKVNLEDKVTDLNTYENNIEINAEQIEDRTTKPIFPDLAKLLETTNAKLSTNETTIQNEANKNRLFNNIDTINSNNSPETQNLNDQTTKFLKEFDEVLAEVQRNNNSLDAEALLLDDINDILNADMYIMDDNMLNIDDLLEDKDIDVDSTYNFQEIKHKTSIIAEKGYIFTGHTLQVSIPGKPSKDATEDTTDVISISSNENFAIIENNSTISETTENEKDNSKNNERGLNVLNSDVINEFRLQGFETNTEKGKELKSSKEIKDSGESKSPEATYLKITDSVEVTKSPEATNFKVTERKEITKSPKETTTPEQTKESRKTKRPQTIYTVSLSSEEDLEIISIKSSEDESDCGYHSSDFEFITEEEATKDGFIINFVFERHYLNKVNSTNKNQNTVQNDPNRAGPSGNYANTAEERGILEENSKENEMPQEQVNQMVNMFQVMPALPPGYPQYPENKCCGTPAARRTRSATRRRERDENEHFRGEALETMNRILSMYPNSNTKMNLRKRRWMR